jgi:phosphatidate cytidylyltransferase
MLWEYLRLTLGRGDRYIKAVAFILAATVTAAPLGWLPAHVPPLLAPAGALLLLTAVLFRPEPMQTSIQRAALVALGIVYCAGLIPYLAVLRSRPDDGLGLCLMALFCTWASDTGAYFVGRAVGRHKLYPKVSPGKTVEGGIGGLLTAVAMAFAIRGVLHLDLPAGHTALLGAVSAAFGAVGDLCESMLKRSVGAKDSSKLIPGHGGVLDRFDGVMFAVPAFYIYIALFLG